MKIKTSELTGAALDWAVAKCEGLVAENGMTPLQIFQGARAGGFHRYSTDWSQGGPIIEREGIELHGSTQDTGSRWAQFYKMRLTFDGKAKHYHREEGRTSLIAAMRCFVASKLGDEVDIPEELLP